MLLRQIFDPHLAQYAYLIGCQRTGEAIVIDPERDVERYRQIAEENDLQLVAVAETHIHADFVSGARALVETHGAHGYLSAGGGPDWQSEWARGLANVTLLHDGDQFRVGNIRFDVLHTPGHTPEHICFLVTDEGGGANEPMALLSGDFLFVGDAGRPDLLETAAGIVGTRDEGAQQLHKSLQRLAKIPEHLQVLPAHGAGSACGKALGSVPTSTIGYERRYNPTLRLALDGSLADFTASILAGQPEPPLYFAEMKRVNRAGPALIAGPTQPRECSIEETAAGAERGKIVVVDTRSREAFVTRTPAGQSLRAGRGQLFRFCRQLSHALRSDRARRRARAAGRTAGHAAFPDRVRSRGRLDSGRAAGEVRRCRRVETREICGRGIDAGEGTARGGAGRAARVGI